MESKTFTHEDLLAFFNYKVELLILKGYASANKGQDEAEKYKQAKTPVAGFGGTPLKPQGTLEVGAINQILEMENKVWIGMYIPKDHILVDIDDEKVGREVADCLKQNGIKFIIIKTHRGYQYIFKDTGKVKTQTAKQMTLGGIIVDYRLQGKGYTVIPTPNIPEREIQWVPDSLDSMPDVLLPVRSVKKNEEATLEIPIEEGGRNSTMLSHAARVRTWIGKYRMDVDFRDIVTQINELFCHPPLSDKEISDICHSADKLPEPEPIKSRNNQEGGASLEELCGLNYVVDMPYGFFIDKRGHLAFQGDKKCYPLCQPFAITGTVKPEEGKDDLGFILKDCYGNEMVLGMNIADRKNFEKEITSFLEKPIDGSGIKHLQTYVSEYYRNNQKHFVVRLGFKRTGWKDGIFVIPTRQYDNVTWTDDNLSIAYTCSGSREEQLKTLKDVLKTPASIVVLSALASTLVKLYNIPNLIVYVTGTKGKGKSTSTAFSESLLGNPRMLKATWFSTKVGKEGFMYMNTDLPVWIDELETLGRNIDEVINTIYQYESGMGKVRGKVTLTNSKPRMLSGVMLITAEKDLDTLVKSVSNVRTVPLGIYRRTLEIKADKTFFTQFDTGGKFNLPQLNKCLLVNYGWFGKEWLQFIESNRELVTGFYEKNLVATSKGIGEMEGGFAAILTVIDILQSMNIADADTRKWLQDNVIKVALAHRDKNVEVEDIAFHFKQKVSDFCNINRRSFVGLDYAYGKSQGYFGEVDANDVFLLGLTFERLCKENGWVPEQLLKDLKSKGWLDTTRGYQKQKRIFGKKPWGYLIKDVFEPDDTKDVNERVQHIMEAFA